MNTQGSCVAVYSARSFPCIINVVKHLKAVNYSAEQLSLMGKRANLKRGGLSFPRLCNSFDYEKKRNISEKVLGVY